MIFITPLVKKLFLKHQCQQLLLHVLFKDIIFFFFALFTTLEINPKYKKSFRHLNTVLCETPIFTIPDIAIKYNTVNLNVAISNTLKHACILNTFLPSRFMQILWIVNNICVVCLPAPCLHLVCESTVCVCDGKKHNIDLLLWTVSEVSCERHKTFTMKRNWHI